MSAAIEIHPVDRARWPDLETFFEARGGPHHCWCMAWRRKPPGVGALRGTTRKQALKAALASQIGRGEPVGVLGYAQGVPVAWCSIAPKASYRRLGGPPERDAAAGAVWAIACFFIRRDRRGQGLMTAMLEGAIAEARRRGAAAIEAYPVDRDAPSYRFMGFVDVFARAGFHETGRAGHRRHVMRLPLV
ncbi:MAG: GNAT family N-acetyltransferase [Azospirillaceae bacterium]